MRSAGSKLASALALLAAAAPASAHLRDGPDADLCVRVEPGRVRLEVLANLLYADLELGREARAHFDAPEAQRLGEALLARIAEVARFELEDAALPLHGTSVELREAEPELAALFPIYGARAATRYHLVLEAALEKAPTELALRWSSYPPDLLLATAEGAPPMDLRGIWIAPEGAELFTLRASAPVHRWRAADPESALAAQGARAARLPLFSIAVGLALLLASLAALRTGRGRRALALAAPFALAAAVSGRGLWAIEVGGERAERPSEERALATFHALHAGLYRAATEEGELALYDALARAATGEYLERLYERTRRSTLERRARGTEGRVTSIAPREARIESIGAREVQLLARWSVEGALLHFGHVHALRDELEGRYRLVRAVEGWRIAGEEILTHERTLVPPGASR